jgi:hypothetical protein
MKSRHDTLMAARQSNGAGVDQEGALADFAEDLGRLLGTAEPKAATWLDQRKTVAEQLAAIRDKASELLTQLGGSAASSAPASASPRRGRRAGTKRATGGSRKRRRMSAEARERIAEAQRQRWAKVRKAKGAA